MQVVEIDHVGAEVAQRPVGGAPHVLESAVAPVQRAVVIGRQRDLFAPVAEHPGDQLLVRERAVRLATWSALQVELPLPLLANDETGRRTEWAFETTLL